MAENSCLAVEICLLSSRGKDNTVGCGSKAYRDFSVLQICVCGFLDP